MLMLGDGYPCVSISMIPFIWCEILCMDACLCASYAYVDVCLCVCCKHKLMYCVCVDVYIYVCKNLCV